MEALEAPCHLTAMTKLTLPSPDEMTRAFLSRDPEYEGVFVTGVVTTGIFCRPTCSARKPRPENIEFYPSPREALLAGYHPCQRCRPMEPAGTAPAWLQRLLLEVESDPARRWTDADLRSLGVKPDRVRRWFQKDHGMTFHSYSRARRLGLALGRIRHGSAITPTAFDHGYDSLSGFHDAVKQLAGSPPRQARDAGTIRVTRILTPLGPMVAGATQEALCLLEFAERRMLETQLRRLRARLGAVVVPGSNPILGKTAAELERYFSGELRTFSLPLSTPGSDFQQQVWSEIRTIPHGETRSYGELARAVGRTQAVRAVARATGDNRIAIVIPCHRVIGTDGRLTGYGGGLWRKRRLLELEGAPAAGQMQLLTMEGGS